MWKTHPQAFPASQALQSAQEGGRFGARRHVANASTFRFLIHGPIFAEPNLCQPFNQANGQRAESRMITGACDA